ncbi:hypothetical protein [Plantactinospora sonchi]|uniref:DUF4878 domain-containing protein n=1 Tax=Plantactinospora sonchi TaxID=1544735 RepID=A0ABU7RQD4_9ACTN
MTFPGPPGGPASSPTAGGAGPAPAGFGAAQSPADPGSASPPAGFGAAQSPAGSGPVPPAGFGGPAPADPGLPTSAGSGGPPVASGTGGAQAPANFGPSYLTGAGAVPPGVPGPPPGPGAVPPFAAPPTEGRTLRMWLGIGVAALAVLLVCGGGGAALIGLLVSSTEAVNEQAKAVVTDYFDAVDDEQFSQAYNLLCDATKQRESPTEFARRVGAEPDIASFQVGDLVMGNTLSVPVDVTYAQGGQDQLHALLEQDPVNGLTICEIN